MILKVSDSQENMDVAILISDKIYFKLKMIKRNKECHCVMRRMPILQEDIALLNIYVPNGRVPKYVKQNLT